MVTLVSPTLLTNGITAKKPPVLSMEVHYLPDPYNNVSSSSGNNNNSNNITLSQLRPYFLLRRERRLPQQQQQPPPPTPPNCGGDHASGTADNDYRYQLCEMTLMVNHMVNNNNNSSSSNNNNNNNNSYQSFLIANHNPGDSPSYVVQDGSLYALTPVDPLFWLLRDSYLPTTMAKSHTTNEAPKLQWQPLWQFLQEYDPVVQQCVGTTVPPRQYRHLLNEMSMGDDDEDDSMVLVQFSVEKALRWLHLKQQTVEQYLLQSTTSTSTSPSPTNHASQPKGGFSSGFTIAKENNHGATTVPNTTTTTATITAQLNAESKGPPERHNNNNNDDENEETQAEWRRWMMIKEESIQLVSNYLSSAWQAQWLHYLNQQQHDPEYARWIQQQQQQVAETTTTRCSSAMNDDDTTTTTTTRTTQPTVDWNMSLTTTTTMGSTESLHVSKPPPMTAGAKRLLKPSSQQQRGLQSVASFFQSKKLTKK